LAYKGKHAVDMETGANVAVTAHGGAAESRLRAHSPVLDCYPVPEEVSLADIPSAKLSAENDRFRHWLLGSYAEI
jgi:hypothetical protein